jgi:hypothetical protein
LIRERELAELEAEISDPDELREAQRALYDDEGAFVGADL